MNLSELQKHWNALGVADPMWAILTVPSKKGGKWDVEEFFRSGEREIDDLVDYARNLNLTVSRGAALDFGCGIGRLSQALCRYAETVHGVDIAPSMVEHACRLNRYGSRCTYHVNETDDLSLFDDGTFDFVYSNIVLQHVRPEYAKRYVREFLRVLRPRGIALFQLPSHRASPDSAALPIQEGSLPNAGFRAGLAVDVPQLSAVVSTPLRIDVRVTNASRVEWPVVEGGVVTGAILLEGRWLDGAGNSIVGDIGFTPIPRSLSPGAEIVLRLTLMPPDQIGSYLLELDVIQFGIARFRDRGSDVLRRPVIVTAPRRFLERLGSRRSRRATGRKPEFVFEPMMEMYGVPKDEVLALLASIGAMVVDVREVPYAGPSWIDFRYCVRKG